MQLTPEITDKNLITPLPLLRTECGLAFLYFGLLIGLKASNILDNPALLGMGSTLFWITLYFDLSRNKKITPDAFNLAPRYRISLAFVFALVISLLLSFLLVEWRDPFFLKVESFFRVIQFGDSLTNWTLLSMILVTTHLLGNWVALYQSEKVPYSRLFPLIALGLVYFKGVIS